MRNRDRIERELASLEGRPNAWLEWKESRGGDITATARSQARLDGWRDALRWVLGIDERALTDIVRDERWPAIRDAAWRHAELRRDAERDRRDPLVAFARAVHGPVAWPPA